MQPQTIVGNPGAYLAGVPLFYTKTGEPGRGSPPRKPTPEPPGGYRPPPAIDFEQDTMIVVMKHGATQQQIDHMIESIEQMGLRSHVIVGTDRTVIAALGEKRDGAKQSLERGDGVEKVMPILA